MNCEQCKLLICDFLADELTDQCAAEFVAHVSSCPECMRELEEMRALFDLTRGVLRKDRDASAHGEDGTSSGLRLSPARLRHLQSLCLKPEERSAPSVAVPPSADAEKTETTNPLSFEDARDFWTRNRRKILFHSAAALVAGLFVALFLHARMTGESAPAPLSSFASLDGDAERMEQAPLSSTGSTDFDRSEKPLVAMTEKVKLEDGKDLAPVEMFAEDAQPSPDGYLPCEIARNDEGAANENRLRSAASPRPADLLKKPNSPRLSERSPAKSLLLDKESSLSVERASMDASADLKADAFAVRTGAKKIESEAHADTVDGISVPEKRKIAELSMFNSEFQSLAARDFSQLNNGFIQTQLAANQQNSMILENLELNRIDPGTAQKNAPGKAKFSLMQSAVRSPFEPSIYIAYAEAAPRADLAESNALSIAINLSNSAISNINRIRNEKRLNSDSLSFNYLPEGKSKNEALGQTNIRIGNCELKEIPLSTTLILDNFEEASPQLKLLTVLHGVANPNLLARPDVRIKMLAILDELLKNEYRGDRDVIALRHSIQSIQQEEIRRSTDSLETKNVPSAETDRK